MSDKRMKIAIAGAGLTGAYLYRRLRNEGFNNITLYDIPQSTSCGINPCAWGVSIGFESYVERAGLDPARYILNRFDYAVFDEVRLKIHLTTIHKPRLIRDLLGGAEVKEGLPSGSYKTLNADKVIDATGVARAALPKIPADLISPCIQHRMVSDQPAKLGIKLGKAGYSWIFPLTGNSFHAGAGSLAEDPAEFLSGEDFSRIDPHSGKASKHRVLCSCTGNIRLTAPRGSLPFVQGNVWGVGEAVGVVAPLAGYGIVPGLESCEILLNHWNDPDSYTLAILKKFAWMEKEPKIIGKMRRGERISLFDAWTLTRNSRQVGMNPGLWQAFKLLKRWK